MERKVSAALKRPGSSVICYSGSAKEAPSGDEANLIARKQNQQQQRSAAADTHTAAISAFCCVSDPVVT